MERQKDGRTSQYDIAIFKESTPKGIPPLTKNIFSFKYSMEEQWHQLKTVTTKGRRTKNYVYLLSWSLVVNFFRKIFS